MEWWCDGMIILLHLSIRMFIFQDRKIGRLTVRTISRVLDLFLKAEMSQEKEATFIGLYTHYKFYKLVKELPTKNVCTEYDFYWRLVLL